MNITAAGGRTAGIRSPRRLGAGGRQPKGEALVLLMHSLRSSRVPPNMPMLLTATIAARGVLRPPCLLRMSAADWRVRLI